MANCPYCKEEIEYVNQTSSYLQEVALNGLPEIRKPQLLEQHYQCPECGEILSEDDLQEMVKPKLKPKTETAKQGAMGI